MASQHLLSYGNCLLEEDDLKLLQGPHWVNDKLIDFAFEFLTNTLKLSPDIVLCCAEVVQLIKLCDNAQELGMILENLDLSMKKWIFLPVNNNESLDEAGGSHWSLLVYEANSETGTFMHFDSLHQNNYSIAKRVASALAPIIGVSANPTVQQAQSPIQQNGYDCGVYTMEIANVLLHHISEEDTNSSWNPNISQISSSSIKQARERWSTIILNLADEMNANG